MCVCVYWVMLHTEIITKVRVAVGRTHVMCFQNMIPRFLGGENRACSGTARLHGDSVGTGSRGRWDR